MYGLEKKEKATFEFDLEKDLKSDPAKVHKLIKMVEGNILEIKGKLRQGAGSEEFDNYGILLHGYAALQRVLNRIATKKQDKK
ncbi:MAG: DUF5398 family protein [Chlamydiales bacterium]|nr:DUF5398 family protein [Chlamydiales bacterium]